MCLLCCKKKLDLWIRKERVKVNEQQQNSTAPTKVRSIFCEYVNLDGR
jgi:hypothetical protein